MNINRRDFVRHVGGACATATLSSWSVGTLAQLGQTPQLTGAGSSKPVHSICEMCSFRCKITAQIIDQKAVFIHGNSNSKAQGTRVCARGTSGINFLYDPQRIVQPLKRVSGPRGAGVWEVISWENAYKEIAEKLNTIKKDYGAHTVMFSSKSGSLASHLFHFAAAYGSPNTFTHASTCPGGVYVASNIMTGTTLGWDVKNTKYYITLGHNLYEGIEVTGTNQLMQAQDNGAKVVSFDPRLSVISSKADEWHPVKPGGDVPLLMAMCHVMIEENLYNKDFIAKHTSGFEEFARSVKECTPEWAQQHSDVNADAIRRITREIAAKAPHVIVSQGHRGTFSTEEFDMRRLTLAMNALLGSIEAKGGLFFKKGADIYNKIAGESIAPKLGRIKVENMPNIPFKRLDQTDPQYAVISKNGGIVQSILDAALMYNHQPYPAKAWIMSRHNPMQTVTDRAKQVQALQSMKLVVCCDVYMTESASYADYILPDTTYLERDEDISDVSGLQPALAVRQQVIDVIGNARPSWQIWKELAQVMELEKYYPWEDMIDRQKQQLDHNQALFDEIKAKGFIQYGNAPLYLRDAQAAAEFIKHYPAAQAFLDANGTFESSLTFKTPDGKMRLASPELDSVAPGFNTPQYRALPMKNPDELFFIQGKVAVHTNGATQYIPVLNELMNDNPLWIHPDTAKPFGIKTGDYIWVYNDTGKEKGRAMVTTGIRPDTVFAYMGGGSKIVATVQGQEQPEHLGIHCGNLLPDRTAPVAGTNVHTSGVKIRRA